MESVRGVGAGVVVRKLVFAQSSLCGFFQFYHPSVFPMLGETTGEVFALLPL